MSTPLRSAGIKDQRYKEEFGEAGAASFGDGRG